MRERNFFIFFSFIFTFWFSSIIFWMEETSNNPFGNVLYEVNIDSSKVNHLFYDLAKKRYECLNNQNLLTDTEKSKLTAFLNDEYRGKAIFRISNLERSIIYGFSILNDSPDSSKTSVRLGVCYNIDLELNLLDRILYDEHLEHSYVAWHSFETDVLDELGLEYKKNWGHLLRNWYARWFFKNQLYIIGVAILLFKLYDYVQNRRKKKLNSH